MLFKFLRMLWLRFGVFDKVARERMLRIMVVRLKGGRPLSEIFATMQISQHSKAANQLAQMSIEEHREKGSYMSEWGYNDYWPKTDGLLLGMAERQGDDAVVRVAETLMNRAASTVNYWNRVMTPNFKWGGGLMFLIATLMFLNTKKDIFGKVMATYPDFLIYGDYLWSYWMPAVIGAGVLLGLYYLAYFNLQDPIRTMLHKTGLFLATDKIFALEVCDLLKVLLRMHTPVVNALQMILEVYGNHPRKAKVLTGIIKEINQGTILTEALRGTLMSPHYADYLGSLCPKVSAGEIAEAMPIVVDLIEQDVEKHLSDMKMGVTGLLLAPSFFMMIALMPLMVGSGFSPSAGG